MLPAKIRTERLLRGYCMLLWKLSFCESFRASRLQLMSHQLMQVSLACRKPMPFYLPLLNVLCYQPLLFTTTFILLRTFWCDPQWIKMTQKDLFYITSLNHSNISKDQRYKQKKNPWIINDTFFKFSTTVYSSLNEYCNFSEREV